MAQAGGFVHMTTDMGIDALRNIPRRYVNENRKKLKPVWPMFMTKMTSDQVMEEWEEMGGFGDIPLRDEGDYLNFARLDVGNKTRIEPETRQLAFAITAKDKRFNKINKVQRASKKLVVASRRTEERIATSVLNQGFSTAFKGSDGQPLFADAHVRLNGATSDNKATVDLTVATLEDALATFRTQVEQDGTFIDIQPKYLVVHPSNEANALRILNAQNYFTGGTPGAADTGVPNKYIQQFNLVLVVTPYLTDTNSWFLLASPDEEDALVMVENEAFHDKSFVDEYTDDFIYSVQFANVAAFVTDIGTFGSTGS